MKKHLLILTITLFSNLFTIAQTCTKTILNESICYNSIYMFDDLLLHESGTYFKIYEKDGYDSIVKFNLTVQPQLFGNRALTLCEGDSIYLGRQFIKNNGIYFDTTINIAGCDSITQFDLTFVPKGVLDTTIEICQNKSTIFNGKLYKTAGTYKINISNGSNCDSTITLHIIVNPIYNTTSYVTVPNGSSYTFYEKTITKTGIYKKIFQSQKGCDSTITLNITFSNSSSRSETKTKKQDQLSTQTDEYVEVYDGFNLVTKGYYNNVIPLLEENKLYIIKGYSNRKLIKTDK